MAMPQFDGGCTFLTRHVKPGRADAVIPKLADFVYTNDPKETYH